MTAAWVTIGALTVGTFVAKAVGPGLFGDRRPTKRTMAVTALVAPAILAALVLYETLGTKDAGIVLDARAAGVGAAALALVLKAPLLVVILVAAAVTALVRAFT